MTPLPPIAVDLTSSGAKLHVPGRPGLERRLVGLPLAQAARLAPLLFNLCPSAQDSAAREALGLPQDGEARPAIRRDILRDHLFKVAMEWPGLFGLQTEPALLRDLGAAAHDRSAAHRFRCALFGEGGCMPETLDAFARWYARGQSAAAAAIGRIAALPARLGRAEQRDRPDNDPTRPWENTPAGRMNGHPLLQGLVATRGRGALWRMAGRLVELERVLSDDRYLPPVAAVPGWSAAPAPRGTLHVRASVEAGRVTAFERITPTDTALARRGQAEQALATLDCVAVEAREQAASIVMAALDPSDAFTIRAGETSDA